MKYILLKIKRLLYVILLGIPVTIWLLLRNSQTTYYIPHLGLGEYCIELGYLDSYKKQHGIDHVTLIVPPNRIEVAKFYPYWDSLLILRDPFYLSVACMGSLPVGRFIHCHMKRINSISFAMHVNKSLLYHNPGIAADDLVKMILKIPYTEDRKAPQIPETSLVSTINKFEKYGLVKGKTILLNPYTGGGAVQEIPEEVYETLAVKLMTEGFKVATIIGNTSQRPVKGTPGILTSLAEAWHLIRWCDWLIGTRSGFFDFAQLSGIHIIALYDSRYKMRELFSLKAHSQNSNIQEYVWDQCQKDNLITSILSDCRKWAREERK